MPLISRLSSITIVWLYILAIIVPVIAPSIPNIGNNLSNIGNSIGEGVNQIGDLFFPPVQTSPPSSIPSQSNNNSSTNTTYFSPTPPTVLPMPKISLANFRNIKEFSVPKLVGKVRTTFGADNMAVRLVKAEPGKIVFDIEDYVAPNIPRKLAFQMQALKSLLKSNVVGAVYVNGAPTTHYEAELLGEKWLIVEVPHLSTITITATVGSNVTTETQIISLEDFANFTHIIIPTEIVARYQHSPAQFRITEEYLPPADKPDTRGAFYIPVLPVIKIQSVDPYEALLEFIMSYWWMILTFILLIVGGILILKE